MKIEKENVESCGCSCKFGTKTPCQEIRIPQPGDVYHQRPNTKSVQCQTQISFLNGPIVSSHSSPTPGPVIPRSSKRIKLARNVQTQNFNSQVPLTEEASSTSAITRLSMPTKNYISKKNRKIPPGKVVKKYRNSRMHKVKREEYKKLREMVPSLQEKNNVSKVVVIEETVKYIDELHSALIERFRAKGLPLTFNGVQLEPRDIHDGNIRELVRRMLANANPNSLPPSKIENVRTMPSFLQKLTRPKKS